MKSNRSVLKEDFITKCNLKEAEITHLIPDASKRTYSRIKDNKNNSYILMDAPPEYEDVRLFIKVTNTLRSLNLSAPEIIEADISNGFLLLEDFGDDSINKFISKNSHLEEKYYLKCVDVLSTVYQNFDSYNEYNQYDFNVFLKEALIFSDYAIPSPKRSIKENEDLQQEYHELIVSLYNLITVPPKYTLVLRDYHADNLHILPMRKKMQSIGLLDYQDALIGHPSYDLMSLLEDARRDVGINTVYKCIEKFIADNFLDPQDFMFNYYIWALQRNLKIIGIFNRKFHQDNNLNYKRYLPRVWRYIIGDIKQPHLLHFKDFIEKMVSSV